MQEAFENRQKTTEETLEDLLAEIARNEQREREQTEKGLDALEHFVLIKLTESDIPNAEEVSGKVRAAFARHHGWQASQATLRELRREVTFALYAVEDDMEKVASLVESLFSLVAKPFRK